MKKFKLTVKGVSYEVTGDSLETVEGWENGIPEIWKKNKKKIVEEDLTSKNEESKRKKVFLKEYSELINDEEVLIELIKFLKKFKKKQGE